MRGIRAGDGRLISYTYRNFPLTSTITIRTAVATGAECRVSRLRGASVVRQWHRLVRTEVKGRSRKPTEDASDVHMMMLDEWKV